MGLVLSCLVGPFFRLLKSETQSRGGLLVGSRVQGLGVPLRDR